MTRDSDSHDFIVTNVELASDQSGKIAIDLTDKRGGAVRLHLDEVQAAKLAETVAEGMQAHNAE